MAVGETPRRCGRAPPEISERLRGVGEEVTLGGGARARALRTHPAEGLDFACCFKARRGPSREVIAGQDPEPARVQRERFPESELHAEVCNSPGTCPGMDSPIPGGIIEVLLVRSLQALQLILERGDPVPAC